jgi:hypothetical protein
VCLFAIEMIYLDTGIETSRRHPGISGFGENGGKNSGEMKSKLAGDMLVGPKRESSQGVTARSKLFPSAPGPMN